MRGLRGAWRLGRALVHGLHGIAVTLVIFPGLDRGGRRERVRWWAAKMLRLLGVGVEVQGALKPGAKMIVANHVSWLDVMVVHAICPEARFVAKAEVRDWPLVARLVDAAETLYIERGRKRDAMRVVHQCAQALRDGETVVVFPEGTTGSGVELLPFHANLLQAAIAVDAPLQPVALRYADRLRPVSPSALWIGDTSMAGTLWLLASADGLVARLQVLPAQSTAHADRRALAARVRIDIAGALEQIDARHPQA